MEAARLKYKANLHPVKIEQGFSWVGRKGGNLLGLHQESLMGNKLTLEENNVFPLYGR